MHMCNTTPTAATAQPKLLLLSSVDISSERANRRQGRPQPDYQMITRGFDADILDARTYNLRLNPVIEIINRKLGLQPAVALQALPRLHQYQGVLAFSDDMGLPMALLMKIFGRRTPLYIICQNISTRRPAFYLNRLKVGSAVRRFLCLSEAQARMVMQQYRIPPEQIALIYWHIDHRFWSPQPETPVRNQICSAGLANRDYATLIEATRGLDVDVKIDANSAWYQMKTNVDPQRLHTRVEVRTGKSTLELRQLYAESQFVVVPLLDVPFPVGYTVLLEAMAMGKPVIVSRISQHGDFVQDGENGFYVNPQDPADLRARIQYLLDRPDEVRRMGANARATVEAHFTLDHFARRIHALIQPGSAMPAEALAESRPVSPVSQRM